MKTPWAYFRFANLLIDGKPIKVYNKGDMYRDFTFIDDVVDGLERSIQNLSSLPQYAIYNIGNSNSEKLMDMIDLLASELDIKNPILELLPMQPGDVYATCASIEKLKDAVGYTPKTSLNDGLGHFCKWFKDWRTGKHH